LQHRPASQRSGKGILHRADEAFKRVGKRAVPERDNRCRRRDQSGYDSDARRADQPNARRELHAYFCRSWSRT
jgi:hypothetical protein